MDKIKEMGEGIVVKDAPVHKTTADGVMAKGKRSATDGKNEHFNKADHCVYFYCIFSASVCFLGGPCSLN